MGKGIEEVHRPMKQGAIAGEYRLESFFSCHSDELGQERVEQRLAHDVEIEKTDLPLDFVREKVEFFCAQLPFLASMLGTKVAVEVASVGYFYITAIYHFLLKCVIFLLFECKDSYFC